MRKINQQKTASLTFRGFRIEPSEVVALLGVEASQRGRAGEPVRAGSAAVLKRSFVRFEVDLVSTTRLDEVVPAVLNHVGGVPNVAAARQIVAPEFLELDIAWPVKHSDEQEGGFIPVLAISDLSKLECILTFSFK